MYSYIMLQMSSDFCISENAQTQMTYAGSWLLVIGYLSNSTDFSPVEREHRLKVNSHYAINGNEKFRLV